MGFASKNPVLLIALQSLLIFSCAQKIASPNLEVESVLPQIKKEYGSYKLEQHSSLFGPYGVALRFVNQKEFNHHADVFIYPVPESIKGEGHSKIVSEALVGSLQSILNRERSGDYDTVNILSEKKVLLKDRLVSIVKLEIWERGIPNLSYLFLTEKNGELFQGRVTHLKAENIQANADVELQTSAIFSDLLALKP